MSKYQDKINELDERLRNHLKNTHISGVILPFITYFLFFLINDTCYSVLCYYIRHNVFDLINLLHFSPFPCLFTAAVLCLLPKTAQRIAFGLSSLLWTVYGFAQLTVVSSNGSMVRFVNVFTGKDAVQFAGSVLKQLPVSVYITYAILILLAVLIEVFLYKKLSLPEKGKIRRIAAGALAAIALVCTVPIFLNAPSNELSNRHYIYKNFLDANVVFDESDLYIYAFHDIRVMVMKGHYAKKDIKKVDAFFENKPEHNENEMTGVFKGKNLLIVQMESFNLDLITSGFCQNIKEVYDKSITFPNYYGMRFGSEPTIGNEMALNTGLYATTDLTASHGLNSLYFPYSLSREFSDDGYDTGVYHYNGPGFYNRGSTEKAFGYKSYTPFYTLTSKDLVLEDDLVLAREDDLYGPIVAADGYMHYFIGFSAHTPYYFGSESLDRWEGAARLKLIEERHPDYDLDLNDPMSIYRGYALLEDDFVGALIDRMEADGTINDTVILFVSDHACLDTIERANSSREYLDIMRIPCFIYTGGIEHREIEKTCSNVDLLPTLLNMFDIESDFAYVGNDIFDPECEGVAYLPNFNWVTDKCICISGDVSENFTDEAIDKDYLDHINGIVRERIEINNLILYTNYYKQ